MPDVTREQMHAYLDDALPDAEGAKVEQALRASETLRQQLKLVMQERDRGDHSVGAIWRRERLSCPPREQLGSYLLDALDDDSMEYLRFHLTTIACPFCSANLADMQAQQEESTQHAKQRRQRIFQSSAGLLSGKPRK